ncbi:MAG: 50S ribosomal protein L35ae [Nanoarchaeota archaeon]|nr:50S ribosomal protein L35ae [Nanoarchaeota archaeon]|tara:strand:+ start:1082 stop:1339 length:258 start_codon:yes stop_codon:yes gene_type:complete
MEATIVNFRRSRHHQNTKQVIVKAPKVNSIKDTESLLKKTITWKSPAGKEIKGEIRASHGNKGCVRVLLETGLPGQALGQKVKIE